MQHIKQNKGKLFGSASGVTSGAATSIPLVLKVAHNLTRRYQAFIILAVVGLFTGSFLFIGHKLFDKRQTNNPETPHHNNENRPEDLKEIMKDLINTYNEDQNIDYEKCNNTLNNIKAHLNSENEINKCTWNIIKTLRFAIEKNILSAEDAESFNKNYKLLQTMHTELTKDQMKTLEVNDNPFYHGGMDEGDQYKKFKTFDDIRTSDNLPDKFNIDNGHNDKVQEIRDKLSGQIELMKDKLKPEQTVTNLTVTEGLSGANVNQAPPH